MEPGNETPQQYMAKIAAARLGCGQCRAVIRIPPAGPPFSSGPWRGRYLCAECWSLYWADHPEDLADQESYEYVTEEAREIRRKRESKASADGAEVLYEDGENRVFLSKRGTLLLDIRTSVKTAPNEYDPERFQALMKAIRAVSGKVPGYEATLTA